MKYFVFSRVFSRLRARLLLAAWCAAGLTARAAVYYVSPSGDDASSGRSPRHAWCSLARVNRATFSPGDSLLFEGGGIFPGTLRLDAADSGTPLHPVQVGAYRLKEKGRPIILAEAARGVDLYNVSSLRVSDLIVRGGGRETNAQSGILLLSSRDEGARDITLGNVEVSGFGNSGISIGVWETERGYEDVRIHHASLHDNGRAGFFCWGKWGRGIYSHRRITIEDTIAHHMPYGSGLILSSVSQGTIQRCTVFANGSRVSGAAGIWAWDSTGILFQYNESYANRTTGVDGDGFDFDGGVSDSVMQYNYSHDNDAAGFLLAQYAFAPQPMRNIVIRYNISENDCRRKGYGAIHVWKGHEEDEIQDVQIYQNTVYLGSRGPAGEDSSPVLGKLSQTLEAASAIAIISPTSSVSVRNNLFCATGGWALVSVVAGQQEIRFCSNAYWSAADPFHVEWMGAEYSSLHDWLTAAADQERLGSKILAINADPLLEAPGAGGTLGRPDLLPSLRAYRLKPDSPLRGRGVDLAGTFGIDPGAQGFFGSPVSSHSPPAIGADIEVEPL